MHKQKILIILILVLGISFSYSQNSVLYKKINIDLKNTETKNVLKQITKITGYFFTYNPDAIKANKKINISSKNKPLKEVLADIFPENNFVFKVIENHIVICRNEAEMFCILNNTEKDTLNHFIKISGKVINKRTKNPIPFASVGIHNSTIGTITNENGNFFLKLDTIFSDSTFFIANLGFETIYKTVSELKNKENNFSLNEEFVSIQEVIIRTKDPNLILTKALKKINKNYIQNPNILTAFYREGTLKKEKILTFSEAFIKIYKTPYKTSVKSDRIKINKSRKILNTEQTDTVILKLKNGLYSVLKLDIIKNKPDFLDLEKMKNYKYQITDIVTFGNKNAYAIEFSPKGNMDYANYKGKIYIETQSLAILSSEYELSFKTTSTKPNFVAKKSRKLKINPVSVKYRVNYRSVGNKYFLNHVRADLEFKIKKKRKLLSSKYKVFMETAVFDMDTVNVKAFSKKDSAKKNMVFVDGNYKYDAKFWGQENFIKPEKSIEESLEKIKVKLDLLR